MNVGRGPEQALVVVDRPESMNLLGLLMRGVLWDNLAAGPGARRALAFKGDVLVQAGAMTVTLRFDGTRITILRGAVDAPAACVTGSVTELLGVVADGGVFGRVLSGRIAVRGNLVALLRILPLFRATRQRARPDR